MRDPFAIPEGDLKPLPRSKTWRNTVGEDAKGRESFASLSGQPQTAPLGRVEVSVTNVGRQAPRRTLPSRDKPNVANLRQSFEAAAAEGQGLTQMAQRHSRAYTTGSERPRKSLLPRLGVAHEVDLPRAKMLVESQTVSIANTREARPALPKSLHNKGRPAEQNDGMSASPTETVPPIESLPWTHRKIHAKGKGPVSHSRSVGSTFLATEVLGVGAGTQSNLSKIANPAEAHQSRPSVADLRQLFDPTEKSSLTTTQSSLFKILCSRRQTAPQLTTTVVGTSNDSRKPEEWRVFRDASASYAKRSKTRLQKNGNSNLSEDNKGWKTVLKKRINSIGSAMLSAPAQDILPHNDRLVSIEETAKLASYPHFQKGTGMLDTCQPEHRPRNQDSGLEAAFLREPAASNRSPRIDNLDGASEWKDPRKPVQGTKGRRRLSSLRDKAGCWFQASKSTSQSQDDPMTETASHFLKSPAQGNDSSMDGVADTRRPLQARPMKQEAPPTARPLHSRIRALRSPLEESRQPSRQTPPVQQHRLFHWARQRSSTGEGPLVKHASCRMHHPRPTRPVRLGDMKRMVSIGKDKGPASPREADE